MLNSQNQNKILIKNKSGQIKTVNLNLGGITVNKQTATISNQQPIKTVQPVLDASHKSDVLEPDLIIKDKINPSQDKTEVTNVIAKEMAMPAFYFQREDEEEVAKFKNKDEILAQKKKEVVLSYVIDKIIKESNLNLELGAKDRLVRVIESRLREIRDLIETKEALLKDRNNGGANLDQNQAKELLKIIEKYRLKIYNGDDLEKEVVLFKNEIEEPKITEKKVFQNNVVLNKILKPQNQPAIRANNQEIIAPQNIKKMDVAKTKPSFSEWLQKPVATNNYRSRVVAGPLEELATINLEYFRQLGRNPIEASLKIKHKIDLLTEDSFERRMEGIKSWRQSPIYNNYLALGGLSVETGKSITEVIQQKQMNNEPCLTEEEFSAMADLNQELVY